MASGDVDSELSITDRDRACLRFEGEEYLDQPRLGEDCERNLIQLCLEPKKYGAELFSSTLVGNLLAGYNSALARARQRESRLRLRLRIEDKAAALHALRWEWLYDPHRSDALGASHEIALSRYMNLSEPSRPAITQKPRLLIALADPSDLAVRGLPAMDREQALEALKKTLVPLENQVEWEVLQGPVTPSALSVRLLEGEFHILHLQAHGLRSTSSACLVLEDEDGKHALVDEESLSQLFAGIRSLRLVTLISCHSAEQTQDDDPFSGLGQGLVRRGIPAVVAMRQAISFGAAARFCDRFYGNLARSGCVDAAVNEARNQLLISREKSEFGTPVVYTRLTNGLLWEVRRPEPKISSSDSKIDWEGLVDAVKKDDLLPFLGPGLWRGLLPSRSEIAKKWIGEYGEEFPTDVHTELSAVAQVLEAKVAGRPREKMLSFLASELIEKQTQVEPDLKRLCDSSLSEIVTYIASRHFARVPQDPHRLLAELRLSTYVTTNPDGFMTEALRWAGREPVRKRCLSQGELLSLEARQNYMTLRGTPAQPLVFHLYGSDEKPASMVLTEDDHLDFLRSLAHGDTELPEELRRKLTDSMLLFLGYDVRRLDCRVLLRGLVADLKKGARNRIAVLQVDPEAKAGSGELASYMENCCEVLNIKVFSGSVQNFLVALRDRLPRR